MNFKVVRTYIAVFLVLELLIGYFVYNAYENRTKSYYQYAIKESQSKYDATLNAFNVLTDHFFSHDAAELAKILHESLRSDAPERALLRVKLQDRFTAFYQDQKLFGLEVFHLFDREGNSFFRFHKPEIFGDPIYKKRFSLRNMRENFTSRTGLEVGTKKESFRFQYPLFYDGEFVGSYEYGISDQAVVREMHRLYGGDYVMLLKRKEIESIVSPQIVSERYGVSPASDAYFFVRRIKNSEAFETKKIVLKDLAVIREGLKGNKAFALVHDRFTLVFLPIRDIEGRHIAFFVSFYKDAIYDIDQKDMLFTLSIATLLLLGLLLFIFTINKHRRYIRAVLDTQKDIMILTNGEDLRDINQRFLDYFGYESLGAFKKEHACVCDYFIEEEGYLSTTVNGVNWIDYMLLYPTQYHKVKMVDAQGVESVYELSLNRFEKTSNYIITLHDITLRQLEQKELEQRASYDTLTEIYNRERFDFFLKKEIAKAERYQIRFSLIMFDIDHFKQINDTKGHDAGDRILQELVKLVQSHIRDVDTFARWGGEEFMIIVNSDLFSSEKLANKLRKEVETFDFSNVKHLTCSFGVVSYEAGDTTEKIVKRCDNMLYAAKHAGRNRVVSAQ